MTSEFESGQDPKEKLANDCATLPMHPVLSERLGIYHNLIAERDEAEGGDPDYAGVAPKRIPSPNKPGQYIDYENTIPAIINTTVTGDARHRWVVFDYLGYQPDNYFIAANLGVVISAAYGESETTQDDVLAAVEAVYEIAHNIQGVTRFGNNGPMLRDYSTVELPRNFLNVDPNAVRAHLLFLTQFGPGTHEISTGCYPDSIAAINAAVLPFYLQDVYTLNVCKSMYSEMADELGLSAEERGRIDEAIRGEIERRILIFPDSFKPDKSNRDHTFWTISYKDIEDHYMLDLEAEDLRSMMYAVNDYYIRQMGQSLPEYPVDAEEILLSQARINAMLQQKIDKYSLFA